jgi:hypothetical protein
MIALPSAWPAARSRAWGWDARWTLVAVLALALVLRLWTAATPGHHHPDAIYQYLDPARRLLSGYGVVTWEWRVGMRSWLLPALLSGPMALGGGWPIALPRIAVAVASLGIVWSAWAIGARRSRTHAVLGAFVAATWFELAYFGAQTLSEPIATAALLPAAVLLGGRRPSRRALAGAGALLAFACLCRLQYVPAAGALALVASGRDLPRRAAPLLIGGLAVAAAGALVDMAAGATPYAWMFENFRQNYLENRSAAFGVSPPLAYPQLIGRLWGAWVVPVAIGVWFGRRLSPALLAAALINLAVHSAIGHKEYRFIHLTTTVFVVVAALGWAEILRSARVDRRAAYATGVAALWAAASLAVLNGPDPRQWLAFRQAGATLFAAAARDPAACGVAIVEEASFSEVPGEAGLRPDQRLHILADADPANGGGGWRATPDGGGGFDRVVAGEQHRERLSPRYRPVGCEPWNGTRLCLFARSGGCEGPSPFLAAPVFRRFGM